jgi:hypothetical protein
MRECQSIPLKDQAFSTFLGQTHQLTYAESRRFASNLFMKSLVAHPSIGQPFISVDGGQQGWLAIALRRQVSSRLVRKVRKKDYCTAKACEGCALGFTHTRNPRKHCVSSRHP